MARLARLIAIGAVASIAAACADSRISGSSLSTSALDPAFVSTPTGFEATTSSFDGSANTPDSDNDEFHPEGRREHHDHGPNGLMGGHDFMGGGLMNDYRGGPIGGGHPFDHDDDEARSCNFDSSTGTVTCSAETRRGLSITRSFVFRTAAGVAQPRPDSTTNSVTTHVTVTGTRTRRDSTVTTVNHVSDRTVTGLAAGSTQRTVNGTSAGTETTTGRDSVGAFTAARTIGDTVTGIVVPIVSGRPSYPTAGTVIRSMTATLTYAGQAPVTSTRREVLTFDGSAVAQLVITKDGTTKTCTLPLPHGRPVCQ